MRTAPIETGRPTIESWIALLLMTVVYVVNITDRLAISTVLEPVKAEFHLSDTAMGFLTGGPVALFYVAACIPLGRLADRTNRRNMIAIVLALWSAFTIGCGRAATVPLFLACRFGVGIGEAGASPTCISLLSDKFPPARRSVATTIFSLGLPLGAAFATLGGGWLNDRFGWRATLTILGAIGLPLAALIMLCVREPRRGQMDERGPDRTAEAFLPTLRFMMGQRSLRHVIFGAAVFSVWASGLFWWIPAFLVRSHGLTVGQAGGMLGPIHAIGGIIMTLATTLFMAWIARRRDPRWQSWYVTGVTLIGVVPSVACFLVPELWQCRLLLWLYIPLAYCYAGPAIGLIQNLVRPDMRALAAAILLFFASLMSFALAPQLIGWASDMVAPWLGDPRQSLRFVLAVSALTALWSGAHFLAAGRHLEADLARARSEDDLLPGLTESFIG
jgi:MFS family permease